MFLRKQLSPYCIPLSQSVTNWQILIPAIRFDGPIPQGSACWNPETGSFEWGPDKYGYTETDDYHLAIFGA